MTWNIEKIENISKIDLEKSLNIWKEYLKIFLEYFSNFWPKLIWAILILWIWFKIVNILIKFLNKTIEKTHLDPMLKTFIWSLLSIILKIWVFFSAVSVLWVQTTSFIALFTAAWVAIWMSLSGTLQNFAGWIIILAFKIYKIWDYISIWGFEWTVKSIHIFHTIVLTLDRKTIIVPNSQISNGIMINFSTEAIRRMDININVSYETNLELAKKIFEDTISKNENILKSDENDIENEYKILVFINEFKWNSVMITIRYFVESWKILKVKSEIYESLLLACRENNINIVYQELDIKMIK